MNLVLSILLWITYVISLYISIYWFIVFITRKEDFEIKKETSLSLKKLPFISVLIPSYNEHDSVIPSIESVLKLDYPKDKLEVIIINDGSTDNTQEVVTEFIKAKNSYNIRLINQKNQGKAQSLNNGLKIVKGEFFACLDADSFVEPKTLRKMLKVYEDDNSLAIVTPAMKVKSPKTFLQKIQQMEYLVALFISRLMSYMDCIYVAPGPFSLYKTSTITKLGGFDKNNITEDQEIAYRVQKHQYKIKQCPDGYVYTISPKSLKELYKQRNRWFKGSLLNILKYKKMLLNKKYGDFGVMQMTMNLVMFFLSVSTLFFMNIYLIQPIYKFIKDLYLINFDIIPFMKDMFNFKFAILNLDISGISIFYLLLALTFAVVYFSYKNSNEKMEKKNIMALLGYFLIYYVIMSFIIVVMFFEVLIDKKHRWVA